MFIKPSKKWRKPKGNDQIMVPYTYYRLCESYKLADGKSKQRTILGLGELLDFPETSQKQELAGLLTEMINEGSYRMCDNPGLYDAALGFYGKWLDTKHETQERANRPAEGAGRNTPIRNTGPWDTCVRTQRCVNCSA